MALRGKKPETIEKRLKALFYGTAGAGKTTAAIQFPKPYLIDTEKGAVNEQYTEIITKQGGVIFQTSDFDELLEECKALLTEKHEYKTLIIDPLTVLYNDLLDKAALKVGTEFGRHYGEANKKMKQLLNLLLKLDMNVIITSHAKNEYAEGMVVIGQTFDCYKKLDYLFDLVLQIDKRGKQRFGKVIKTRIKGFPEAETFEFSYQEIAKRYGAHAIEKDATPITLATPQQISELEHLLDVIKIPQDKIDSWLNKCAADSIKDVTSEQIGKFINYLKEQVNGNTNSNQNSSTQTIQKDSNN
ncbi:hypothetical protein E6Q11_01790 [Candidatus Dojkabacteria bacterium]|uniref:ATP-binding protein n=1 Tax=Candidatus Dojkabacteria bacterium TaxID=2099670 RepID=A0A5C7J9C4_9BACT|nr:MAG: hypothetical protein E6Q11_01790 [Candidatus Dojkabacteria bacterium]